jgi:lathosterol oxidase
MEMMIGQMKLAQASLLIYAGLPVLSEYLIESGFTRVYFFIDEVGGWGWYAAYLVAYIVVVEIGIYWMHRTLHTNKFLYIKENRYIPAKKKIRDYLEKIIDRTSENNA